MGDMDPLHHEDDDHEATSDYQDSVDASEFTSVKGTGLQHSYQHGRRYQGHLQDRYGLPNDEGERLREGMKHKLYVDYILGGKLFIAPVGEYPQKIVDVGTGFGLWAQEVAEKYPSARVIGTDITPIQNGWSSPNVEYRVEDLDDGTRPWTSIYADADLIHIRALLQTIRNPRLLVERAFANLRPGGWIECHELITQAFSDEGTLGDEYPMNKVYRLTGDAFSTAFGWQLDFPTRLPEVLRDVGFVNISDRHNHVPVGRWHSESRKREMGMFAQSIFTDFMDAVLSRNELLGLTQDAAQELGQAAITAFNNPRIHAQFDWYDCWAQKPMGQGMI